jgi:hypothetical protein
MFIIIKIDKTLNGFENLKFHPQIINLPALALARLNINLPVVALARLNINLLILALARLNFKFEKFFSHIKERIKMHRGLDQNRKKKAVKFLLKNCKK